MGSTAQRGSLAREQLRQRIVRVATVLLALATAMPFLWFVLLGFKSGEDILAGSTRILFTPTLANYKGLLNGKFFESFGNSTIVSVSSTVLSLLIGVPGAYGLSRVSMGHGRMISMAVLVSRMLPPVAFAIPYFLVYRYAGLLDTRTGLVIIYMTFNLSLVVWLMRSFFDNCPRELEEAAAIDGASRFEIFRMVVLPISGPAIATTAILCFLYAWNDFFFALTLTRSQAATAPIQIVNFMNYEGWEWGKIAAAATVIMAPVLLISLLLRRYLVSGMTAGAVKQ